MDSSEKMYWDLKLQGQECGEGLADGNRCNAAGVHLLLEHPQQ